MICRPQFDVICFRPRGDIAAWLVSMRAQGPRRAIASIASEYVVLFPCWFLSWNLSPLDICLSISGSRWTQALAIGPPFFPGDLHMHFIFKGFEANGSTVAWPGTDWDMVRKAICAGYFHNASKPEP